MDSNGINIYINGQKHTVSSDVHPATRLSDYLRQVVFLKGTKVTCREGGCGACVLTVQYQDPITNRDRSRAINSCLCPVSIAQGWKITTTEGLGGRQQGYHPIQRRMAEHSATQCGFCTPGFVMSMNSLLQDNASVSCDQVEKSLDGNLCRCTGYRSILKCMKSFAVDGSDSQPVDIEDLKPVGCSRTCRPPRPSVGQRPASHLSWIRPQTLDELYQLLDTRKERKVRLVFGNTATGVYKKDRYEVYVDIRDVPDLYTVTVDDQGLDIGSSITLSDLMEICDTYKNKPGLGYLDQLREYLQTVANTPIRNAGSWAGNLMIMHDHPDFNSDVYTPLAALGATITIGGYGSSTKCMRLNEFLSENMSGRVILSVHLPLLSDGHVFSIYRVAPRLQNSISYVNLAVLIDMADTSTHTVNKATIVYGGLGASNHRHSVLEDFLCGKSLGSDNVKSEWLELIKDLGVTDVTLEYKRNLIRNLLFKFISKFSTASKLEPTLQLKRPISSGQQDFGTEPDEYPITQPISKLTSEKQAAGEVVYVDDMSHTENELSAVLVLSTIGCGQLDTIDTSLALGEGGAVDVVTSADVPGTNSVDSITLLADDRIEYHGQPVALVLADDLGTAYRAASMVRVSYKNIQKPVTDMDEAISKGHINYQAPPCILGDAEGAFSNCTQTVEGTFESGSQYHFYLENYVCLAVPSENGVDMWTPTQHPAAVQKYVSEVLGVTQNSIHVMVPEVGGAFGGKMFFTGLTSSIAGVAVWKTNRAVRLTTSLDTSMKVTGHRAPIRAKYKIGLDDNKRIIAMDVYLYWDGGHKIIPYQISVCHSVMQHVEGAYYIPNCTINGAIVRTNHQSSTVMRSPRHLPGNMIIEHVMEHVARVVDEDPLTFKWRHLRKDEKISVMGLLPSCQLDKLWADIMDTACVQQRQRDVETFNKGSRWIKRGMAITPSKYTITYMPGLSYPVYMAVCGPDGSVTISHGGVEMGQGLHTKVIQVASHGLGIPIDMIKVRHVDTLIGINAAVSAASMPSEFLCKTVSDCCKILKNKLAPFREKNPEADWKSLTQVATEAGIHLAVSERHSVPEFQEVAYIVHGVCVAEAEVDILTGQNQILRADLLMDIGQSVNPAVDMGQMEGALIMGLGLMLTEKEVYSPETGELLTSGTWDYKVPLCADIPVDLRVTLMKGQHNNLGVYPSKAIGEPAINCSPAFLHAVKAAVDASREERGKTGYVPLYAPATPDAILKACDVTGDDLIY